ncbi:MAG: hypothetical protein WAN60_21415 [Candidatus Sulfotelmatobacter sp.]
MLRPLTKTATACLLGLLVFSDSATSAHQASSRVHFPFAYMQQGCGPEDGLALDFHFTAKKSECGKYSEPFITISIWKNLPKSAPYSMEIPGSGGSAIRCLKPGACEAATSGTLHLDKFIEGTSSSGEYELHFKDGSVESDKFDATACHVYFVCG